MEIISAMILAFILTLFGADHMVTSALSSLLNREVSESVYWFMFFVVGFILWVRG